MEKCCPSDLRWIIGLCPVLCECMYQPLHRLAIHTPSGDLLGATRHAAVRALHHVAISTAAFEWRSRRTTAPQWSFRSCGADPSLACQREPTVPAYEIPTCAGFASAFLIS